MAGSAHCCVAASLHRCIAPVGPRAGRPMAWSARRADSPAVLAPGRRAETHCARCARSVQTVGASMLTKRACARASAPAPRLRSSARHRAPRPRADRRSRTRRRSAPPGRIARTGCSAPCRTPAMPLAQPWAAAGRAWGEIGAPERSGGVRPATARSAGGRLAVHPRAVILAVPKARQGRRTFRPTRARLRPRAVPAAASAASATAAASAASATAAATRRCTRLPGEATPSPPSPVPTSPAPAPPSPSAA